MYTTNKLLTVLTQTLVSYIGRLSLLIQILGLY